MRIVAPPTSGARMQVSVAACLASILELGVEAVPVPDARHPEPWTVWRNWLAERGLAIVPVSDPANFKWPGPWLVLLDAADGEEQVGAIAFGAPPGLAWHPFGGPETFDAAALGYVIAPADVALWAPKASALGVGVGSVEAVVIADRAEAAAVRVECAVARAGRGLEGDRYFEKRGTWSNRYGRGQDLTLIEAEVLNALILPEGQLSAEEARRNVVTRGIELNPLVGKRFKIGEVECFGQRLCEPCAHLARLTQKPGTLRGLIHKGGLRADLLTDGEICVDSEIAAV